MGRTGRIAIRWTRADKNRPMDLEGMTAVCERLNGLQIQKGAVMKVTCDWKGRPKEIVFVEQPESK